MSEPVRVNVALLVDGHPILGGGHAQNVAEMVRDFMIILSRAKLGVRLADGTYKEIAPGEILLSREDLRVFDVQHRAAQPESLRGALHVLAGALNADADR